MRMREVLLLLPILLYNEMRFKGEML
jgi:hypothetical protein